MVEEPKRAQALNKVAECLYRSSNGQHFALIEVRGKQIKRSLKTNDRQLANRCRLISGTKRGASKVRRPKTFFSRIWQKPGYKPNQPI